MGPLRGQRVLVIGLGPMGRGIARSFADAGAEVLVADFDVAATSAGLETLFAERDGRTAGIEGSPAWSLGAGRLADAARCDLVIEAVIEDMATKSALMAALGQRAGAQTLLATNTSSLSVAELGRASGLAERTVGLHFFNPPEKMGLVEVVRGPATSVEALANAHRLVTALGKVAVECADSPGFVVNRTCRPLYYEAELLVAEGVAAPVVDAVARYGFGHRMGPLETLDLTGLHVHLAASETALREFGDPRYRPLPIVRRLVRAGWTGKSAGHGFYDHGLGRPRVQIAGVVEAVPSAAPIRVAGPRASVWSAFGGRGNGAVLFACAGAATDDDVATVAGLVADGNAVAVDSSDGRWLDELPQGAGWVRLHSGPGGALAEVVDDPVAGHPSPPWLPGLLGALGARWVTVPAVAGLIGDRLRHTVLNEATLLVEEGLAVPDDVDQALRLGMGHPRGPFELLAELGAPFVRESLGAMARATGDPRYRPSSLLMRWAARQRQVAVA
jgi:3-hydroxybutyryl-CoA dehydrogenase